MTLGVAGGAVAGLALRGKEVVHETRFPGPLTVGLREFAVNLVAAPRQEPLLIHSVEEKCWKEDGEGEVG